MVALLIATTISCSDAFSVINRVIRVVGLNLQQKADIIQIIREHVPTCPFTVVPDARSKPNSR
jgi:hypothetical protein